MGLDSSFLPVHVRLAFVGGAVAPYWDKEIGRCGFRDLSLSIPALVLIDIDAVEKACEKWLKLATLNLDVC